MPTPRAVTSRLRRAFQRRLKAPAPPVSALPVKGMVEVFSDSEVKGWISVRGGMPPVDVKLRVNGLDVAHTYATPPIVPEILDTASTALGAVDPTGSIHALPPQFRRNSWHEIRTFAFKLDDLWNYTRRGSKVSVRALDQNLPIHGHGMYRTPRRNGTNSLADLRSMLESGYLFSQYGQLQLSKKLDVEWQRRVFSLYERSRKIVSAEFGYDLFLMYGTLLGAVREQGFIAHDIDFDTAYISSCHDGPAAAKELQQIGYALIEHGIDAQTMVTATHLRDPDDESVRLDIFHLFFDEEGTLRFPFGVAGTSEYATADWSGTRTMDFQGETVLVPADAERFVAHVYGPSWRYPKPGFNWALERATRAAEGDISQSMRSQSYWTNFYARNDPSGGSSFCDALIARPDTPTAVLDIGCGNGRDSCAFAISGRTVIGLDFSSTAVTKARARAEAAAVDDHATFHMADIADAQVLEGRLDELRHRVDGGAVMFYLRFFLHAVAADVQESLIAAIKRISLPGDYFAAEFRTTGDKQRVKIHRQHYRRFQDGPAFGRMLRTDVGFTVLEEIEATGLSPYRDEDPLLYRVVARKEA